MYMEAFGSRNIDLKLEEWNRRLFSYYFESRGKYSDVCRLDITPRALGEALSVGGHLAEGVVYEYLLKTIETDRSSLASIFRRSIDSVDFSSPPIEFVYLFFTCLVAGSTEDENASEGNFRKRLSILLNYDGEADMSLQGLSDLWQSFSDWLDNAIEAGYDYRRLSLPDPKNETIIGYSKILCFPSRRDLNLLRELLAQSSLSHSASTGEVRALIRDGIHKFSKDFVKEYRLFEEEDRSDKPDRFKLPFWHAFEYASVLKHGQNDTALPEASFEVVLLRDLNDVSVELWVDQPDIEADDLSVLPNVDSNVEYPHVVANSSGGNAMHDIMAGPRVYSKVPGLANISKIVSQGLLVFSKESANTWFLQRTLPATGVHFIVLINSIRLDAFTESFPGVTTKLSQRLPGWYSAENITLEHLKRLSQYFKDSISCLLERSFPPLIVKRGGIRIGHSYLLEPRFLPEIVIVGAEVTRAFILNRVGFRCPLTRVRDNYYRLPSENIYEEGNYVIQALDAQHNIVARGDIEFIQMPGWPSYKPFTGDTGRWVTESNGPFMTVSFDKVTHQDYFARIPGLILKDPFVESSSHPTILVGSDVARLLRALSANFNRRSSLSLGELLELITSIFHDHHPAVKWLIIQLLEDSGLLNRLTRKNWRSVVFTPVRPQLVHTANRSFLTGLLPPSERGKVRSTIRRHGGQLINSTHTNPLDWNPICFSGIEKEGCNAVAEELGVRITLIESGHASNSNPVSKAEYDFDVVPNDVYDKAYEGAWPSVMGAAEDECRVEWYQSDRGPNLFSVVTNNIVDGVTYSMNWALLMKCYLKGQYVFLKDGPFLGAKAQIGPFLPTPYARWLSGVTGTAPIIHLSEEGEPQYSYNLQTTRNANNLSNWLLGPCTMNYDLKYLHLRHKLGARRGERLVPASPASGHTVEIGANLPLSLHKYFQSNG